MSPGREVLLLLLLLLLLGASVLAAAKLDSAVEAEAGGLARHRSRRGLLFRPGRVQVIIGFGIPLNLPHQAVTMGMLLKSNYLTPSNASMYTRPLEYFSSRSTRAAKDTRAAREVPDAGGTSPTTEHLASRWDLYTALQGALEQLGGGAGSGRQCLLRAVCEAAAFSMRHDGLMGELLHVLLTPSTTREPVLLHQDNEFHAAERAGRQARAAQDPVDACARTFGGCAASTLELISRIHHFPFAS